MPGHLLLEEKAWVLPHQCFFRENDVFSFPSAQKPPPKWAAVIVFLRLP
jgi:hypothetical protein